MSNLEIYNQRFADSGRRVFAHALNGARQRGQNYVVVEHFIEALITEEGRFFQLLAGLLDIDPGQVQTLMARRLENFPQLSGEIAERIFIPKKDPYPRTRLVERHSD